MVQHEKVERVRDLLGFEGSFVVNNVGHIGGIVLLWKDRACASLISFS